MAPYPTDRSRRNAIFRSRLCSLPPEIVHMIMELAAGPDCPKNILPFITCSKEWFDICIPLIWKRTCIQAITSRKIDPPRRQKYAGLVHTILGSSVCGCRRCVECPDDELTTARGRHPDPSDASTDTQPECEGEVESSDEEIIRSLEFANLRRLEGVATRSGDHPAAMVTILHDITKRHPKIHSVGFADWGNIFNTSVLDMLNNLPDLAELNVRHASGPPDDADDWLEYIPVGGLCWDQLVSADICMTKLDVDEEAVNEDDLDHEVPEFFIWILAHCPKLRRLRSRASIFSSLSSPKAPIWWYRRSRKDPSRLVKPKPPSQPFAALEELTIHTNDEEVLHSIKHLSNLEKLSISFRPGYVNNSSFFASISALHKLQHLSIKTSRNGFLHSQAMQDEFSPRNLGDAIRSLEHLRSLTYALPAYFAPPDGHMESTYDLLELVARHNPNIETLVLGFRVVFPLTATRPAMPEPPPSQRSRLHHLRVFSTKEENPTGEHRFCSGYQGDCFKPHLQRLLTIFPELVVFSSDEEMVRVRVSGSKESKRTTM